MPMTTTTMEAGRASSTVSMSFRGRSLLSLRRNQVVSMDQGHEHDLHDLDLFQTHVADHLHSLLPSSSPDHDHPLLSLLFLQKVLDALLSCEEEFNALISTLAGSAPKPPLDRAVSDLLDRAVKSLDICNAISLTLHSLHHWHRHADIAASALALDLDLDHLGPAQLNRARNSLKKLLHRPDSCSKTERSRSFALPRTLSWSLNRNWSATKQVQAMWANLAPPRGGDAGAGLALAVYTMSSLLVFSMWALVAAFPCGERGVVTPVAPPRQVAWAAAMAGLQERILEEWRKREKKGAPPSAGLLAELQGIERCGRTLLEAVEGEAAAEVAVKAGELAEACRMLEEGLGPFERQVREVFHRVVGSRAEVLRCLDHTTRSPTLSMVL